MRLCSIYYTGAALACILHFVADVNAQMLPVVNASFEDTSGQVVFNEFSFGVPAGWQLYNPANIPLGAPNATGTLRDPHTDYFDQPAPDGSRVLILFNSNNQGQGPYGMQQTLAATLQPNTVYQLSVAVGNIGSGTTISGDFFDLSGFPGYRVEILVDLNPVSIGEEIVLASDDNSLSIAERTFALSTVLYNSGPAPALAGLPLAVRLTSLNLPLGLPGDPDSEVDFDQVQFSVVPEPSVAWLAVAALALCTWAARPQKLVSRKLVSQNLVSLAPS